MINCVSKPKKLSKSDKIDKDQEAKDREWLATKTESPHFQVGTDVLWQGGRYTVDRYEGRTIYLRDGGTVIPVHNPYFMQ